MSFSTKEVFDKINRKILNLKKQNENPEVRSLEIFGNKRAIKQLQQLKDELSNE